MFISSGLNFYNRWWYDDDNSDDYDYEVYEEIYVDDDEDVDDCNDANDDADIKDNYSFSVIII